MEKISFRYESFYDGDIELFESACCDGDAVTWSDALSKFIDFMNGAGYCIDACVKADIMKAARESHSKHVFDLLMNGRR